MTDFIPQIEDRPFLIKILILVLIVAVSLLFSTIFGLIFALPFFSLNELLNAGNLVEPVDQRSVYLLKYFQVINQLGVFIVPAFIYAYLENRKPLRYLQLNKKPFPRLLLLSVILILASLPAISWMVEINEQMAFPDFLKGIETWMRNSEDRTNRLTELFLDVNTYGGLIINIVIIALLASLGEELLFRGVVLRILYDGIRNVHLAVIVSAILFSALHMQFYGFLPRMVLGIIFGYLFLWTGSLWIPIILHFVFNSITVVAVFLFNKGIISTDVENLGSSGNSFIIIGSFIVSVLVLVLINKLRTQKQQQ
jgi:membrane protease YdiL (CAAX protease family)